MPKIVIIEDSADTNNHLKSLLQNIPDADIHQAFDRESGEKLISKEKPDLVIVDIDLGPGPKDKYGGFKILSSLQGKHTVTLVVSGMLEENLPDVAISLRAYDFIGKPINDMNFINKVEHALKFHDQDSSTQGIEQQAWPPNLTPDPEKHLGLRWKNKPVRLSITHLRLVHCLINPAGKSVDKSKLAVQLDTSNSIKAVATHICDLRQRFVDVDPTFDSIDNDPGKGYVWKIQS